MQINFKATIKRGEPMPSICKICTSINRCNGERNEIPQENSCFIDYFEMKNFKVEDEKMRDRILSYAPFTNSKRTVKTICGNFSHIKSHRMW